MTFTHLPQIASFIRSTHCSFAGTFTDNALTILGELNAAMNAFPAITGATFEAMTDMSHGELNTIIEVNRMPNGVWQYTETVDRRSR